MLLTLFRLTMIVPLLISAVYQVEANREKLSFVPSKESKSVDESRLTQSAALSNQDSISEDNDSEFEEEVRKVDNEREMRSGRNSVGSAENRFARSEGGNRGLAHKMAKDALKSPKMQETMRRLSHVKSPKGILHASVKVPGVKIGPKITEDGRRSKDARHKGRRKKKRKRHHRKFRTQHAGSLKRGSSKNHPRIERLLRRDPRVLGADDPTLGYQTNYGSPDDYRNENYDASYPVNAAASGQVPGDNDVPESRYNDDFEPINTKIYDPNEVQQPSEQEIPDRLNYLNQYEIPEHLQSLSPSEPVDTDINEAVEPQPPQLQTFNYQPEAILPPADDFQQNIANQPSLENVRVPSLKEEDAEFRTQPSYTPLQLYGNHDEADEALRNYLIQSKYNYPSINMPNAMDEPLGKILESLGINVNGGGSNSFNQNPSLSEGVNHQITPYALEHLISPNYLKKKPQKEISNYYEGNNARGSEFEANRLRNRNNIREGYLRRHSQNGEYGDDILKQLEEERRPTHNMNISIAVHDTKEVANQILDTIMEELEELKADKSKNNKREGLPCRLSGSWSTAQAGVKMDMKVVNRTITVTLSELTGQPLHESLLNATWNISGHVPFKRGAPFSLTAIDNSTSSIAVFVGSCKVCQGVDTIAGVWSIARQPKGCRDFQVATTVFNDIFRKSKLSSLKEKGANSTDNTTKHEKRKS
ncbi:uncharacterized protein LOC108630935 [Ceratina calcarata]|uniref:Uncharacterized protein LOC108630935 n=1 Tax=Ceratina calcarata TaxID=156304 RepID=A0AAJ7SA89_9HYME|nr:uncharacterized protein LOC108630935 [Ceratina calcarata]